MAYRNQLVVAAIKRAFLEDFRLYGGVTRACEVAGVSRVTYQKWREHDERFDQDCNRAIVEAVDRLEEEARRRAFDGVVREKGIYYKGTAIGKEIITEYSDTLLLALLKAHKPEKYKERLEVSVPAIVKSYQGVDVDQV